MKITKHAADALTPGQQITDSECRGFRARCLPSGAVTFSFRYRNGKGQRHEFPLGLHGTVTVDQARKLAMQKAGEVAGDRDPMAERKTANARSENTVNLVLDRWIAHARRSKMRSIDRIVPSIDRYIRPKIGEVAIYDLGRGEVADMLERIAEHAPMMANRIRAYLSAALNWWRNLDEKFVTMPVPGKKLFAKETPRERVLDDDELRDLWAALDEMDGTGSTFPALVRTLLLTACRREEVAKMHSGEIDGDEWIIPADRYKARVPHVVPMIPAIKSALPKRQSVGFVFASTGFDTPFAGFSKAKGMLDTKLADVRKREGRKPMAPWRLHDLRRTARTRMAVIGIADHVAERLLGHVQRGIVAVYNRHDYRVEKAEALTRWARYLDGLVHPSPDRAKVVALPSRTRRNVGRR